jgi:2-dehydropantoate 2-reductase
VTLIGRAAHVQTIRERGLELRMAGGVETVRLHADTGLDALRTADLVLVCVKSADTAATARQIEAVLAPGALLLSLQNGVENASTLRRTLHQDVIASAVYVATALPQPGVVQHNGRGELVVGAAAGTPRDAALQARLHAIVALFANAGVPVRISPDVDAELWQKLVVNCAWNAISALAQLPYAALAAQPAIGELQRQVVREVVAVAHAAGRQLDLDAALRAVQAIATTMPEQRSSTAQDLARGRRTEIDALNGFIDRRGRELGVATPANQALYALVKLVEAVPSGVAGGPALLPHPRGERQDVGGELG